jgi:sugar lactone lactonase YvrE
MTAAMICLSGCSLLLGIDGEFTLLDAGMGGGTASSGASSTSMSSGTTAASGSGGATTGTGGSQFSGTISKSAGTSNALDATPDPAGITLYFTAVDTATALAGVYKAPADGSATTPVVVLAGAPFAAPFGIAISSDGKTLYVADPGATDATTKLDHGVIFAMPIAGGTPTVLAGSEGLSARSLELSVEAGNDVLYFAGSDKATGARGVYKLPTAGGAATDIAATGVTWVDPCGIAVAADGTVYVSDTTGAATRKAVIVKVGSGGVGSSLVSDLNVGYPAGVALSKDGKSLFVSALDPAKHTDVLLQFDVSNGMQTMALSTGIDTLTESAGLHRARSVDVFAFADSSTLAGGGQVFVVK